MKYNIVLIPSHAELGCSFISLANKISIENGLLPNYLLKDTEQLSIPHISVIQFRLEKKLLFQGLFENSPQDILELIWKFVSEIWQDILSQNDNKQELLCTLEPTVNYKHDIQGAFAGVTWSEVLLDKTKNPLLQQFHDKLRIRLEPLGIKCLNASGEKYNPHFTLFNTYTHLLNEVNLIKEIPETHLHTLKSFSIKPALGRANNNWELIKKLREENAPELNLKLQHERR